jgi:hypothetical protein
LQGIGGGKRGLIVRAPSKGYGNKWLLALGNEDDLKVVGQMERMPNQNDLADMVYNASAAESPLTAGARFLRNLVSNPGKK